MATSQFFVLTPATEKVRQQQVVALNTATFHEALIEKFRPLLGVMDAGTLTREVAPTHSCFVKWSRRQSSFLNSFLLARVCTKLIIKQFAMCAIFPFWECVLRLVCLLCVAAFGWLLLRLCEKFVSV